MKTKGKAGARKWNKEIKEKVVVRSKKKKRKTMENQRS